jgi:hypothetical protein
MSLSEMPQRCGEAPESEYFDREIRQLLVEPYRICSLCRVAPFGSAREAHVLTMVGRVARTVAT